MQSIKYSFWKDKFTFVTIMALHENNSAALKEVCFERFGKISDVRSKEEKEQDKSVSEKYAWVGDLGYVLLFYNQKAQGTILIIGSSKIGNEMEVYLIKQTKEGAKKGW